MDMRRLWVNYQYHTQDILRFEWRVILVGILLAVVVCLVIGFGFTVPENRGKWINSAGLLFDVAGVVQLHVSGLFDEILNLYGEEKFPFGPPSHITRKIIDDPDSPIMMWIRTNLFFEGRTGFYFLLLGFVGQLVGSWA